MSVSSSETPKTAADIANWCCVWPSYINSEKTMRKGRKIGKDRAVKAPLLPELLNACKTLELQAVAEVSSSINTFNCVRTDGCSFIFCAEKSVQPRFYGYDSRSCQIERERWNVGQTRHSESKGIVDSACRRNQNARTTCQSAAGENEQNFKCNIHFRQ